MYLGMMGNFRVQDVDGNPLRKIFGLHWVVGHLSGFIAIVLNEFNGITCLHGNRNELVCP